MCYFSAEGRSRDAKEDEVLLVKRQHHGTNWLVSPDDHATAVCMRDGTHLELLYIPEKTQEQFGLPLEATATFKQHGELPYDRDVLVLKDGQTIPLQKLRDGQVIKVMSVPPPLQKRLPVTGKVEGLVSALIGAR